MAAVYSGYEALFALGLGVKNACACAMSLWVVDLHEEPFLFLPFFSFRYKHYHVSCFEHRCFVLELMAGGASVRQTIISITIHAQHCLFFDSFDVIGQLISCKMSLCYAWHCQIPWRNLMIFLCLTRQTQTQHNSGYISPIRKT